jgi:hypothetical protein
LDEFTDSHTGEPIKPVIMDSPKSGAKGVAVGTVTIAILILVLTSLFALSRQDVIFRNRYKELNESYAKETALDWHLCNAKICVKSTNEFINNTDFVLIYRERDGEAKYLTRMHRDQWDAFINQTRLLLDNNIRQAVTNRSREGNLSWKNNASSS